MNPDWVLLTNGLDEGILMAAVGHIAKARVHDAETIIPQPAFDPYPNSTMAVGAKAVWVPPGPDFAFPTQAVIDAVTPRTRMIFLNTPNNPTGQLIATTDLARICEAAPHAVVLIDEAYIEFGGTTFLPQLARYPNVLLGRTFSKAYGLAGLRVGVVIGQPQALDPVRSVTLPFNINGIAMTAMQAALEGYRVPPALRSAGQGLSRVAVQRMPSSGTAVLAQRGQLRDGARRRDGALRRSNGGQNDSRPRPVEGSNHPWVHPDHDRDPSPHARRDRSAGHRDGREAGMSTTKPRAAAFNRQTTETQIRGRLVIDGQGRYDVSTGIRFFDHMLELFTRHGGFDLTLARRREIWTSINTTRSKTSASSWAKPCSRPSAIARGSTAPAIS